MWGWRPRGTGGKEEGGGHVGLNHIAFTEEGRVGDVGQNHIAFTRSCWLSSLGHCDLAVTRALQNTKCIKSELQAKHRRHRFRTQFL